MNLLTHMLNALFAQPNLTPHSRNQAMRKLLAIPVEEPQREIPNGEMEVSCGQ